MKLISPKRIFIFSYKIPFPLSDGGAIAQYFFLKPMALLCDVTFCTVVNNSYQLGAIQQLQLEIPSLKVVYYENIQEKKTSVVKKTCKFLQRVELKMTTLFNRKSSTKEQVYLDKYIHYIDESFFNFFETLIHDNSYDIIQLEFYESLVLLPILPVKTKRIVIHHEVRSKRNSLVNFSNVQYKKYLVQCTKTIETALLELADRVVVFNENDKEYLSDISSLIDVIPFGIPKELIVKKEVSKKFSKFIFIGGENHFPNKQGLAWFLDTIYLPNLKIIDWPIYVVGVWANGFIQKYKNIETIVFTGFVSDLSTMYDEAVMLTPILSGSGIRTKILQSFANKIPVISTRFASEGLYSDETYTSHLIFFKDENDFLIKFNAIKENDFLISIAEKGFDYFSKNFDEDTLLKRRMKVYEN